MMEKTTWYIWNEARQKWEAQPIQAEPATQPLTEIDELRQQLEVACEALHKISKCVADTLQGCDVEAKEALAKIKGT